MKKGVKQSRHHIINVVWDNVLSENIVSVTVKNFVKIFLEIISTFLLKPSIIDPKFPAISRYLYTVELITFSADEHI